MPFIRLTEPYTCDIEWWIAYPADPRWTYHDTGEIIHATAEEAEELLKQNRGVPSTEEEWLSSDD